MTARYSSLEPRALATSFKKKAARLEKMETASSLVRAGCPVLARGPDRVLTYSRSQAVTLQPVSGHG